MLSAVLAVLPVFLVILIGFALARLKLLATEVWAGIDRLNYLLLMPVLLASTLARADFSRLSTTPIIVAFLAINLLAYALLFLGRPAIMKLLGIGAPGFASFFQGCTRWQSFVALALAAQLHGATGVAVVAIAMAVLSPMVNISCVLVHAAYIETAGGKRPDMLGQIVRNPFMIGVAVGGVLNLTGIGVPPPFKGTADLIGNCALGLSLLTVGAGLRLAGLAGDTGTVVASTLVRLLALPALAYVVARALGVEGPALALAAVVSAVPTTSYSYIFARSLGGDAELMARIIAVQVLASAVTLPIVIALVSP